MQHKIPAIPSFLDATPTDPIQEIALRVVVELPGWEFHVLGTATLIGSFLAITAKHVIDEAIRMFGAKQTGPNEMEIDRYSLRLYQVLPGPVYRVWTVFSLWTCPTDIAILHIGLDGSSEERRGVEWKLPQLRVVPPPTGQKVLAFGFRESRVEVNEGADGTHHIVLNDVGTTSIGEVGQIFAERRDASMLTFPCFEVYARFAHGMSGGLIIDEAGAVCGLVCSGNNFADPNMLPLSYAATLWPMLTTVISADRGGAYPKGVGYPMIDLALDNIIQTVGLGELDTKHFPGDRSPNRDGQNVVGLRETLPDQSPGAEPKRLPGYA